MLEKPAFRIYVSCLLKTIQVIRHGVSLFVPSMASFLIPFLSERSYTLLWNESGVKGLTREPSRVARLNTTRGKFLQIMDTQITSWIKTGQVHLVQLFYHRLFQFSGCYCQSLPPWAVLKSFSHTSFHHPGVTLRCEFWKKRFNLSRRSNKPCVSGKKTQHAFFFPKDVNYTGPFSGMILGTTNPPRFFPSLLTNLRSI